ncbi:hypothetical protein GGX14DRAFT_457827, partial [Mycena pura]
MGQYWRVVNLDKFQSYFLWKLGESIYGGRECFDRLLPIHPFLCKNCLAQVMYNPAALNFPVEIGCSEIYRRITALAADYSWAGDRIVCVGDYLCNEDIPEAVLSAEEKKDLLLDEDNERTLYGCPFHEMTKPLSESFLTLLSEQDDWSLYPDIRVFRQLCEDSPMLLNPLPAPRVLRNLTRQQYVRESAIFALHDKYRGTMDEMEGVELSEVLLFWICLSSDPSTSMAYGGDIHRGVWAGDRFDVVSADWLETASGWTDASDEALKEVEAIWVAEY